MAIIEMSTGSIIESIDSKKDLEPYLCGHFEFIRVNIKVEKDDFFQIKEGTEEILLSSHHVVSVRYNRYD